MWLWSTGSAVATLAATGLVAAAVIAGHLLRPRPRRRVAVTSMFWRAIASETPGGRLGGRLRAWLSLALLLAAVACAGLAALGPTWWSGGAGPTIVIVDNGWPADVRDWSAVDRVLGQASAATVIAAAPVPRIVQGPGVLDERGRARLRRLGVADTPAAIAPALRLARTTHALSAGQGTPEAIVLTPTPAAWRRGGEAVGVATRIVPWGSMGSGGVVHARWQSRTPVGVEGVLTVSGVAIDLAADGGPSHVVVREAEGGRVLAREPVEPEAEGRAVRGSTPMTARGQAVEVAIVSAEASDTLGEPASLRLPARQPIRAKVGPDTPAVLRAALSAVGCEVEASTEAIGLRGAWLERVVATGPVAAGSIEVVGQGMSDTSGGTMHEARGVGPMRGVPMPDAWLPAVTPSAAEGSNDRAEPLVMAGDAAVAWLGSSADGGDVLRLHAAWFEGRTPAAATPGFALLIGRGVQRLAGVAAGPTLIDAARAADDLPSWAIGDAGDEGVALARPAPASSRRVDPRPAGGSDEPVAIERRSTRGRGVLLMLAVGLLVANWALHDRGAIA
jgi:hypothetical protein